MSCDSIEDLFLEELPPNSDGLVDHLIGNAYHVVRSVAMKLAEITRLYESIADIDTVSANITNVNTVATNIPMLTSIYGKLDELDLIATQLDTVLGKFTDLASATGSSMVGFKQSGVWAVSRTLQDKVRESVSVFDTMSAEEIADVLSSAPVLDVAPAINRAIALLPTSLSRGISGEVLLPAGRYVIKSPIVVPFGVTLVGRGTNAYTTRIEVHPDFVGTEAIYCWGGGVSQFTNANLKSLSLMMNNVPGVVPIVMAGAYQNSSIQDVHVDEINGGVNGLIIRPMTGSESPSPLSVCESILLKDCYFIHHDDSSAVTKAPIKLIKCQEVTLINVKGIAARNVPGNPVANTAAIEFEDCRGVTVIGGAASGAKYGYSITAKTRASVGFSFSGETYEHISDAAIYVRGTASFYVSSLSNKTPRYEAPQPTYMLDADYLTTADIVGGIRSANLGANTSMVRVVDGGVGSFAAAAGSKSVRIVSPNFNNGNLLVQGANLEILRDNTPILKYSVAGRTDFWNVKWSASSVVNNGFEFQHSSGRVALKIDDTGTASRLGFFGAFGSTKPTVSGSVGGNAALASLCSALATLGLITNSTT